MGHGKPPSCSGCALGCVGAAWVFRLSREAEGALSSDRVEGTFHQLRMPTHVSVARQPYASLSWLVSDGSVTISAPAALSTPNAQPRRCAHHWFKQLREQKSRVSGPSMRTSR